MHPSYFKEIFCRLCLNILSDRKCDIIGKAIRKLLEVVLPNLNLEEGDEHVICKACSVKLFAAFNFKSTCINTEDIIFRCLNSNKVSAVDLKEIYLKEKGNVHLTDIPENLRICRLCIQLVTDGFVSLNEIDIGIINTYIPEVNISATKDPVICRPCFDSLRTHSDFVNNCLDAQEKYKSADKQFDIKFEKIDIKLEKDCQDAEEKHENIDIQSYIKSEEIEIKIEEDDQNGYSLSNDSDHETVEHEKRYTSEDTGEVNIERTLKCDSGFIEYRTTSMLVQKVQTPKRENLRFKKREPLEARLCRCNKCSYETKLEVNLRRHQLAHKTIRVANRRKLRHKNIPKFQMYTCDTCTYETKYNGHLRRHQLMHKDPLKFHMYKCDTCTYDTKYKSDLNKHQFQNHKDSLETQTYKCDTCTYKTRFKRLLSDHQLMHRDPLTIQMYKCDTCSFETKHMGHLRRHRLRHRDPPKSKRPKVVKKPNTSDA
ncbi:zinc finger protein 99-like [Anoplophora glabripennis]|uniref:zinc finger protein 99-like n=1 Tax=Anoplophora glabripennis TaxID=217634 RepID=UPI000874EB02|nr:zinc finger protein 99-like [Anoplophora glabripennis]